MNPTDPARCPGCGQGNRCAQVDSPDQPQPCWCFSASFDPAVLAARPASERASACLCSRCAAGLPPLAAS